MTIRLKNSPNGKKKKRLATEKRCLGGRNKGHEARVRMVNSGNRHQIWMEKKLNGRRVGAGLLLALALFCLSIRAREGYGPGKAGQRSLPVTLVFFFAMGSAISEKLEGTTKFVFCFSTMVRSRLARAVY